MFSYHRDPQLTFFEQSQRLHTQRTLLNPFQLFPLPLRGSHLSSIWTTPAGNIEIGL